MPMDDYSDLMHTIARVETEPAKWIANYMHRIFHPKSVIDIGCANGEYVAPFKERGCAVRGLDGEPTAGSLLGDDFFCVDLRQAIVAPPVKYDLGICLEVAEHLQAEFADNLVFNVANSSDLILWSAAKPGQGGLHHYNCQEMQYWLDKFAVHGFTLHPFNDLVCEAIRTMPLIDTVDWLMDNVRLLERKPQLKLKHNWGGDTLPLK